MGQRVQRELAGHLGGDGSLGCVWSLGQLSVEGRRRLRATLGWVSAAVRQGATREREVGDVGCRLACGLGSELVGDVRRWWCLRWWDSGPGGGSRWSNTGRGLLWLRSGFISVV
ncbi:uncharacterized protein A4U43_C10F9840 [Asparagus officinalis]|uniref:Uncharacterized protein n=1 Tax=Asparagus officinalis TaxID=4686 RepID=A0A5P1E223_ASPOF|nr:uncharacterized protein A4U43_C10F9840 [Asparagus officinalis]